MSEIDEITKGTDIVRSLLNTEAVGQALTERKVDGKTIEDIRAQIGAAMPGKVNVRVDVADGPLIEITNDRDGLLELIFRRREQRSDV